MCVQVSVRESVCEREKGEREREFYSLSMNVLRCEEVEIYIKISRYSFSQTAVSSRKNTKLF